MEKQGNKRETTDNGKLQSDDHLMKKFSKPESSAEIKDLANKINESDPDTDPEKLDKAARQFHKEKREDAQEQAENDADFEQP